MRAFTSPSPRFPALARQTWRYPGSFVVCLHRRKCILLLRHTELTKVRGRMSSLVMWNSDDGDLMQVRESHSISLLSRSTIPSSLGGNAASPPSNGPGLKTGTSFASCFLSGTVTQDRLLPGLGPSSIGLVACEAVNISN